MSKEAKVQKLGEYNLHIFIEDTSSLKCGLDETTNPKIKILAMEDEKVSTQKENVPFDSMVYWGEHFYFSKKYKVREDLENDLVEIKVFDSSKIFRNSLLGSLKISLTSIYYSKGHNIQHQWYILENREQSMGEAMGYIKLSASLVREGDTQVMDSINLGAA